MLAYLDYLLDRVTMYRLVLYYLIAILLVAAGLGAFNLLPFSAFAIIATSLVFVVFCAITNAIFAKIYEAQTNIESTYITALILACIISPIRTIHDVPFVFWAAVLAMASKYILAIRNKHLFNPAAIAVVLTALWLNFSATWWVGTPLLVPIILIGGIAMVRKIRRYDLVFYFFLAALLTIAFFTITGGHDLFNTMDQVLLRSPLLFFAFVMLTEPLTSPPTKGLQIIFGSLIGFLFAPQVHFESLYLTPELALVIGNVFAYLVSPKVKERLRLSAITKLAPTIFGFHFAPAHPFSFSPGQYMEFTLPHTHADSRGNRRYFTIASSPTESQVELGIKFYGNSSTFKRRLAELRPNDTLMGGQIAGDFTLPRNTKQKLAFIAGGIGITPFRSMMKYLLDTNEVRDIVLLYANKTADEIVYTDVFNEAATKLSTRTIYTLNTPPPNWQGRTGALTEQAIKEEVPDYLERIFYISGPHGLVVGMESVLQALGVKQQHIKKDFFPGLV